MFNKKKRIEKAFVVIQKFINKYGFSDEERRNLLGLLKNIKIRLGV